MRAPCGKHRFANLQSARNEQELRRTAPPAMRFRVTSIVARAAQVSSLKDRLPLKEERQWYEDDFETAAKSRKPAKTSY